MTAREGRSAATHQFHRGALRVLRPHYLDASGQVTYTMVNPGGAFLDGDRYRVAVTVEDHADLLLTTQSATKIYRTPVGRSTQEMTVRLGAGARLEYLPDQLIAYRDSRYRQHTLVDMDPSATLVLAEVVTPGWSPTGEPFRYDSVRLRTEVRMSGRPVALDNIRLEPSGDETGFGGVGSFEGFSHVGSLLVLDPRADDAALAAVRALLTERAGYLRGGASALAVPGFALRVLGDSTQEIDELILAAVAVVRKRFFGQEPVNLRKY
ncbi:urease accessory protein UreD [Kocuria marina]|uniref:Urease accessory protein UreD n=1 Tax=Kocuria marina TaxID=223184 RepID=A0A0B0DAX2_9MICC|nr:urease accessory protein UreD [Kocuria marina]